MKILPKVSIILVNFNGEKFIEKCLCSLSNINYPSDRIEMILVDNGSKDNSLNIIKKFPKIKLIKNEINNYCRANNLGIQNSTGSLIAFLNNDTEVEKNWLIELVKVIQMNKNIGIVGSKIIFFDGLINSVGQKEHPSFYFKDEGFKEEDKGQYDRVKEVESLCGCSVLYKKSCIKDIGLFDEDLVIYCEDVDMALRCKKKGWKLYYAPKSVVKHEYNGTSNLELQEKYVERNRLLLLAKHQPDKLPIIMFNNPYFQNNDEIFYIMPEVVKKIVDTHGFKKFEKISKDLFENLKNHFYSRKDYLIKSFEIERRMFKESKERLRHTNRNFEKELKKATNTNKSLLESQKKLRMEFDNEIQKIKRYFDKEKQKNKKLNTYLDKEKQKNKNLTILKIRLERELEDLTLEHNNLKRELNNLYNSKGYKWVLSNIWTISNKFKNRKC